ncbi:claudin-22-like [Hyperolius riggenbachi]|uniref:claudin-22-like n=1 Tax=Hyperolius riggenbachi TaxID=752182 RepID=UPI0035A2FDD6
MDLSLRTKLQYGALFFALLGCILTCVSTFVPLWKNLNLDLNELEFWNTGLFQACIMQDEGGTQCKEYDSFLALPFEIRMARILMLLSDGMGIVGVAITCLCLDCLVCGERNTKKYLAFCGGGVLWAAGITALVPVSWIAYNMVQEFWDETIPEIVPRWEFGDAMFMCWFGSFFLMFGGSLLFCAEHPAAEQTNKRHIAKETHSTLIYHPAPPQSRSPDLII